MEQGLDAWDLEEVSDRGHDRVRPKELDVADRPGPDRVPVGVLVKVQVRKVFVDAMQKEHVVPVLG